jgi:DNA-binding transcriptional regulator YiaG
MSAVAFGYRCQECGKGVVREHVVAAYNTKIRGLPFTVKDARVGKCELCGAEHFSAEETERWTEQFEAAHEAQYLAPSAIGDIRKRLGLTAEQFAFLIGCTRQSLYNWERPDRERPQARMADLLMKLVSRSISVERVDVIGFLADEARQFGLELKPQRKTAGGGHPERIRLLAEARPASSFRGNRLLTLAADSEPTQPVTTLVNDASMAVARLNYDFPTASLEIEFVDSPGFEAVDAEIELVGGKTQTVEGAKVSGSRITLLTKTDVTEEQVKAVLLSPVGPWEKRA